MIGYILAMACLFTDNKLCRQIIQWHDILFKLIDFRFLVFIKWHDYRFM